MNKTTKLALLALAAFGLSAQAAVESNSWWSVEFTGIGDIVALTNAVEGTQPYPAGVWTTVEADESYITNEYYSVTTNGYQFGYTDCLKLDTQGTDLTWTPAVSSNNVQNVVDADLYLVGSDSEPSKDDFDSAQDVQTAIYLKNELDPDSGEITNSVLCIYVYNNNILSNGWQELEGVELDHDAWAHVQVTVDHTGTDPMVSVKVNGTQMHARGDASTTSWRAANFSVIGSAVTSVAFRGTGAVDNFVGTFLKETVETQTFTAQSYLDDVLQTTGFNPTVSLLDQPVGTPVQFVFSIDDRDAQAIAEQMDQHTNLATYALSKIEIYAATGGTAVATFNYTYSRETGTTVTCDGDDSEYFAWVLNEDDEREDNSFTLTVPTTGAESDVTIAKVYYVSFNAPSQTDPVPVDPGTSLTPEDIENGCVPAGVEEENGTEYFVVNFYAPEAGVTYTLMSSTSLTLTEDQWKGIAVTGNATAATGDGTATSTSANQLITLKAEITEDAAFFKIRATK